MNKIIKEELNKVRVKIPEYDEDTTHIFIPQLGNELQIGKKFIIEVPNYIVNEPEGFTLSANWNKGIKPKTNFLMGTLINKLGKMYQFNFNGWDNVNRKCIENDVYSGLWLPLESIKIIQQLD